MKYIGRTFSKVIIKMIHQYGFVHADPHSGNLLVRKLSSGRDQLVLLDHGLCQRLDEATRNQYNWFWLGLILNDQKMAAEAA
jgi:aarF domain-containing kinase